MILIPCPHCGDRNSSEFTYAGEVHSRPSPGDARQGPWRDYLYGKDNPAGWTEERWFHGSGCGKYLRAERHTVTNEIRATRPEVGAGASSRTRP